MEERTKSFDFRAFGQAIKKARNDRELTREQLGGMLGISPRYLVDIENEGQHPSLQVLYELVTLFDISADQFFFPDTAKSKTTRRRQLENMLDEMDEKDLIVISATVKGLKEVKETGE
jgi:transcriptional regulator with XRE-family HTH domain